MARRPTISDLAEAAGVSVATVDRLLNGRERVRHETASRIYESAKRIGFRGISLIGERVQTDVPHVRLGFILQKEKQAFYQAFAREIAAAAAAVSAQRITPVVEFAATPSPSDVAAMLRGMAGRVEAVAATAVNHHAITAAVTDLKEVGVSTFALLSDFAQGVRESYVGMNNLKIGRMAAWMIATAAKTPGRVGIFVGGHRWHGHELRETGFRSFFRESAPQFEVLDTLVNLETRQLTYEATLDLLARQPQLRGIYIAGGGMEGAIAAVREVRAPGELPLVVNELTPESAAALSDGYVTMVDATPLPALCRDLIAMMLRSAAAGPGDVPGQHFVQPELYLPESV
ncbi:MAG: LacI family DNA-binding transcriptional regulator [Paracoccaceae bacterium]